MAFTRKNDEAVSPVIGVILMVAITVILAAVIAAFVFGMSGNISKTKIVAVTTQQSNGETISITYQGGQDATTFSYGDIEVIPASGVAVVYANVSPYTATAATNTRFYNNVGAQVVASTTTANGFSGRDHVIVTGVFTDGAQQVLLDSYV